MLGNFESLRAAALNDPQLTPKPPPMLIRDMPGSRQELVGLSINA